MYLNTVFKYNVFKYCPALMARHKILTLVSTEAGRPEVKKRKYANQHKI